MANMASCSKCHNSIPSRSTKCPKCGTSQKARIQAERDKKGGTWGIKDYVVFISIIAASWATYKYFNPPEPYCPPKPQIVFIAANGGDFTLEACWNEPSFFLDLREIPQNDLSLKTYDPLLQGRTLDEFILVQTHYPGLINGHVRLLFNRDEMRRIGLTRMRIAVTPK